MNSTTTTATRPNGAHKTAPISQGAPLINGRLPLLLLALLIGRTGKPSQLESHLTRNFRPAPAN